MKLLLLIVKNVGRNSVRSILTALGTMVLVLVVTLVWSVLHLIDLVTEEKSHDLKAFISERWSVPSRLPYSYGSSLGEGAARKDHPEDARPTDSMTWQFYGGTLDPKNPSMKSIIFCIACEPDKIATMMSGLEGLSAAEDAELHRCIERLKAKRDGIILGRNHLLALSQKMEDGQQRLLENPVGRKFSLNGFSNFKDLDFDFEIVGVFPAGRYDGLAAINRDYYNAALDAYPQAHSGRQHPMADRSLSLVLVKVNDKEAYNRVAEQITNSPYYHNPQVKCETESSGIGSFLDAYRDLLWGMRWLLTPACLGTLALVLANAISISVRERRTEMAVLKVLGFRPGQIVLLVMGESVLLGLLAGFASGALTYMIVDWCCHGVAFPMGFFPVFMIPINALWWGPAVGAGAALAGSLAPAWSASRVKPAEVFAKIA
ncbi:MAG: ABC transporter permease [Thermoguttaceae bacterium]|jgi:putative ABC transport system permease protein